MSKLVMTLVLGVSLLGCGKTNQRATERCQGSSKASCGTCCSANGAPANVTTTVNGVTTCTCKGQR